MTSKTVDILESLGKKKTSQILVGFALETNNELSNAKENKEENLDAIILNSLADTVLVFSTRQIKSHLFQLWESIHLIL